MRPCAYFYTYKYCELALLLCFVKSMIYSRSLPPTPIENERPASDGYVICGK